MRDAAQVAYAQARIQARFGNRPGDALWRELEAGRDLPHLIEIVRGSSLGDAAETLAGEMGGHALEARLRGRWTRTCNEIARWYPPQWRPSFEWLAWLPWLAPLQQLARQDAGHAWMEDDPLLGKLAAAAPADRADVLEDGPLAPLAAAWRDGENLAEAWHAQWRAGWPADEGASRQALRRLDGALAQLLPGGPGPAFDARIEALQAVVTRLFRRRAGTPDAGLALVVLLALDHLRLRSALAVARSFGPARAA